MDQSDQVLQIIKDQQQLVNQLFLQLTQEKEYSAMLRMEANSVFNFQHKKIQEQQNQLKEEREQHLLNYDTLFYKANATAIQQQTQIDFKLVQLSTKLELFEQNQIFYNTLWEKTEKSS